MVNEVISHENNHLEAIVDFFNSDERWGDSIQRRDYFEHLDEDDFIDLVQQIAGLIRTGNSDMQRFDGENVSLVGHEVPDQREKEQLLRDTWSVSRGFLADNEIPDEDALDYAALTIAGGLLYAHPFADGNGRTSRAISYLIARGNGNETELHDILANNGGGGKWQVAPVPLVIKGQTVFEGQQPNQIEWEDSFMGEAMDALGGVLTNSLYKSTVIRKFIEEFGELAENEINDSSTPQADGSFNLNGEEFIAKLVNNQESGISNASKLLKIHREARADYVHRFLRAMQTEERLKPRNIRPEDFEISKKDNEFNRERKRVIIKEVGKRSLDGLLTPAQQQLVQHRALSEVRRKS